MANGVSKVKTLAAGFNRAIHFVMTHPIFSAIHYWVA